jgi:thiol-disulfide isomerase/thioredoxin
MKILNRILFAIVLPLIFACTTDPTGFEIVIKGGEHFPDGAQVHISRRSLDNIREYEELFKGGFEKGAISYKGQVESPHIVRLDMRSADGKKMLSGIIQMPLEPGKTEIDFSSMTDFTFKGGKYGEMIVNSVNNDPAYRKANKAVHDHKKTGFTYKDEEAMKEYYRLAGVAGSASNKVLARVYSQQDDPLAKLLLHGSGYYSGNNNLKMREELANQLGDNREAILTRLQVESAKKANAIRVTLDVGNSMKDFTANNLNGESFQLSEVMKKNKYVLVELWASWCAPCRAEIPHMKRAYEAFNKKGFEIVSFSLDEKRKAWEKASNEENIPWINTSDLKGYESPVAKMFATPAVPANWLVEASTGKIIAIHVRGKALDHKLEELLK